MFSASVIDSDTIRAYLETDYRVEGVAPMTLNVGIVSSRLADLHIATCVFSSAFITACNPYSEALDESANVSRQLELARELQARGLTFIEGVGQHPSNRWPAEASFLVLGLSLDTAKALGVKHHQNALIWAGPDAVPQLILLR